jgi:PHS family inorganic phosphate transporter-like MFS transporter
MLFSPLLGYILIISGASLEFTWRFLLAFGAVPAIVALYFRLRMKEPQSLGNAEKSKTSDSSKAARKLGSYWSIICQYKIPLIATTMSWFLLDVTFYGTGEFKHTVATELFPDNTYLTPSERVASDALFGIIISAIALPGYICACIFIDKIGRWRLQVGGFAAMTIAYVLMGLALHFNAPGWLNLFIFGLTFFFTNFGPNTTTFIIPSEIYPHAVRATCHGLSAAAGKAGAIAGAAGFSPAIVSVGLDGVIFICAGISIAGLVVTWTLLDRSLVDNPSHKFDSQDIEIGKLSYDNNKHEEKVNDDPIVGTSSITASTLSEA